MRRKYKPHRKTQHIYAQATLIDLIFDAIGRKLARAYHRRVVSRFVKRYALTQLTEDEIKLLVFYVGIINRHTHE